MDNIINFKQDFIVCVMSRASLAQRARREREKFLKRARDAKDSSIRVISKASLVQRVRCEREGFAKRARLEQDIIAQDSSIRIISKASLAQRARREREGFAKHARLEHDTIAQEDGSDLEYDLDASPPVSAEASAEAAACVKVLISSGLPSVVNMANGTAVEASMTINVPNAQSSKAACGNILPSSSIQGTNITVPVSIQKQSSAGIASEAGETTGDNSQAHSKRRKKVWAEEEDIKLVAAVKQCGEGNWAGMAKEHFKGDRTLGQLYQRWTTMKRKNNSEAGGTGPLSSQKYEQAMATRQAIDMALKDSSFTSAGVDHSSAKKDPTSQKQPHHQVPIPSASKAAVSGPPPMPRPPLTVMSPVNPTLTPDSMVKAAARAAGARIASKSEAAIFKETQSKKVVHFPLVKPSGTGAGSLLQTVSMAGHPNVKIFRSAASTAVPATFTRLPVAQANLPRPPTSAVLPQSATTVAATPSPVAAENHPAEVNRPRLAAPPVVPQSVKPVPAPAPSVAATVVLLRPTIQRNPTIQRKQGSKTLF